MSAEQIPMQQLEAELRDLVERPPLVLELSRVEAFYLFAQLQLALRHPENVGASAEFARELAQRLIATIATTPALARIAAAAWDPAEDLRRRAPWPDPWKPARPAHPSNVKEQPEEGGCG